MSLIAKRVKGAEGRSARCRTKAALGALHVVALVLACAGASPTAQPRSEPPSARATRSEASPQRAILRRHPALQSKLAWVRLAHLPTPVEASPRLAERLGIRELWIKRDDLSADPFGGSKVRKLELFFGDALRQKKTSVLTFGGVGSNHALATAIYARRLGLRPILLLLPQQKSAHVRYNLLAAAAAGAEIHPMRSTDEDRAAQPFTEGLEQAAIPYVIPTGGTAPLGDVGLVNAGFELAEQIAAGELPEPDEIWVALGTGGTAAGIALGVAAAGLRSHVVGVRVSSPSTGNFAKLANSFAHTRDLLRALDPQFPRIELDPERVSVLDEFAGNGYGIPSERGRRAQLLARESGDLDLDDTYTAKAFSALVALAPGRADKRILFWNTYDGRRLAPSAIGPERLPPELRGYVR